MTGPAHIFDKPNRYIGKPEPRADAVRLLQGRGNYVDDQKLPRMVHAAFVRSPHAHAIVVAANTLAPVFSLSMPSYSVSREA